MDNRYEQFNEITFEAYIKSAIDRAVKKARKKQADREQREQSFSTLTDAILYSISQKDTEIRQAEQVEQPRQAFFVQGENISISVDKLGQTLSLLLPRDREIVLMYYCQKMNDKKISHILGISRSTVQRHRNNVIKKLRTLLEVNT